MGCVCSKAECLAALPHAAACLAPFTGVAHLLRNGWPISSETPGPFAPKYAALLDAIHAAISGTDAATIALAGVRSTDPDHQRAADLLAEVAGSAPDSRERARQLRTLLARKNTVEYESRKASVKDARDGVERASRIVDWAKEVLAKARL